jgi:hypothetical protein
VPLRRLRRLALRDMPSLRSGMSALISRYETARPRQLKEFQCDR